MTQKDLFFKLIGILQKHNISYAITGRTEGYPNNIGSDVDNVTVLERIYG